MANWKHMSRYDYDRMWSFIHKKLRFRPQNCNAIIAPAARTRMIDITDHYIGPDATAKREELRQNFLKIFRSLTSPAEYIYALDWEHDSYVFSSYEPMEPDEAGDWPISPAPGGHYVFFITADLRNAYCADGINMRIYLVGGPLIRLYSLLP